MRKMIVVWMVAVLIFAAACTPDGKDPVKTSPSAVHTPEQSAETPGKLPESDGEKGDAPATPEQEKPEGSEDENPQATVMPELIPSEGTDGEPTTTGGKKAQN